MIKFYYHPSPNPAKVALCLEETGLDYEMVPVDTRKGEQFDPAFTAINPNAKTPALVDEDSGATLFDSNAILLYLAEKTGQFAPKESLAARSPMWSWLMFIGTGVGPYSGQAVHFTHFAPGPQDYAVNRYQYEVKRHWRLLDDRLADNRYLLGEHYSIVDMALWGWAGPLSFILGDDAWASFPNAKRLVEEINGRPAAERALALKDEHAFKSEMDDQALRYMFPQNYADAS